MGLFWLSQGLPGKKLLRRGSELGLGARTPGPLKALCPSGAQPGKSHSPLGSSAPLC